MGKGRHREGVTEREKRILILLLEHRAAWFPPAWPEGDLFSNFTHHTMWGEWEGREKDQRTEEEKGGPWRGGGAEVLLRAIVSDRPSVCLPGVHCVRGSAALPNQFSGVLHFGRRPQEVPQLPVERGVLLLLNPLSLVPSQATRLPTGSMRAPLGRSAAPIRNIRRWNWRKSFCSTCTSPGTAGTRWPDCSTSRKGRLRSGSRTAG